jgi:hypothetical protein
MRYPVGGAVLTPAWFFFLVLVATSGCSLDRGALAPLDSSPPPMDAAGDGELPRDTGGLVDIGGDGDSASDAIVDAADGALVDASDAAPDVDTSIDTLPPPNCADLFRGSVGFRSVCEDSPTRCVLEIDTDPARRTCASVCTDIGWTCMAASGAASTTPRCAEPAVGACDQDLRVQVCVCTAP